MSNSIEAEPHGNAHVQIGGPMGDFREMWSSNDPFFWLHHGFMDKLWFYWQTIDPKNVNKSDGAKYGIQADASLELSFGMTVGEVLDSADICVD